MITIQNANTYSGQGEYVGRTMPGRVGSVLANQFKIGKDGDRDQVIEKYRAWLRVMYKHGGRERIELERLAAMHKRGEDIVLVCWCAPLRCHAEVIRDAIMGIASRV